MLIIWPLVLINFFSIFWRFYKYYQLAKIRNERTYLDFVDYFDNLTIFKKLTLAAIPFPIIKKSDNEVEDAIRKIIIITILATWTSAIMVIFLNPGSK
jgi:hypothetical protein